MLLLVLPPWLPVMCPYLSLPFVKRVTVSGGSFSACFIDLSPLPASAILKKVLSLPEEQHLLILLCPEAMSLCAVNHSRSKSTAAKIAQHSAMWEKSCRWTEHKKTGGAFIRACSPSGNALSNEKHELTQRRCKSHTTQRKFEERRCFRGKLKTAEHGCDWLNCQ